MFSLLSSIAITNMIYLVLGKLFIKTNISNLKDFSEIAIIGFIYSSFLALLINFFNPLDVKINTLILLMICLIFFFRRKKFNKKELLILIVSIFFCFFVILLDTINRPDAGMYHLPFIKIINEEKIIFGLANLHARFGHISIMQYASAINNNFLIGDIGILIPLVSIYSFLTFYFLGDILDFLFNNKKYNCNYLSVFFSLMVVLYISYKINRYGEFGNDAIAHLLYFYLISKLINYKKFDYPRFNKIYLISVFAILNKFMLIFSIFIPVYIFLKDKVSFRKAVFSLPTIFLCLWILRNIITSGCAVYPQINTCFTDLKWSNEKEITLMSETSEAWSKDWPNSNKEVSIKEYSKNFNWLNTWKNNHFKKIIKILIPYLILLILIFLYFKFIKEKKYQFNLDSYIYKLPLLVSLIGSLLFFLKFPIYRYGYSYLISSLILILIYFIRFYDLEKIKKLSIFVVFIFCASFIYKQTDRYTEFNKTRNLVPEIYNGKKQHKTIQLDTGGFYNYAFNGSCMYDANLCTVFRKDNLLINKKLSYKFFEIK